MGTADQPEPTDPLSPGAVEAAALQFIAEGVTELAGFDLAAISIVHDGRLHTVAIAGADHGRAELSTRHPAVADVLAGLRLAEDWGPLRFVPHEREPAGLADYSFISDVAPLDAPDAWHPHDLLVALLEDARGQLRGVLSVDLPRNGLRPGVEQRRVLEVYARQAGRAVVTLLERQEFEREMRRERATSDYRGDLIAGLSHQLQNPVAAIMGNLELLLDGVAPGDPSERLLRAVERAAGKIAKMGEDLLALAKVNDPERPLQEVDVDLAVVVREVVDAVTVAVAASEEVGVAAQLPVDPLLVRGDPAELEDLVANLVANAIKYSDPGGSVTVTGARVVEGGAAYVELRVSDRGIGIAEDDLAHLFEDFYRSERREVHSRPGTGLGLAVVDRVVHRHGGRIEVESELGLGTTFRVLLPAR